MYRNCFKLMLIGLFVCGIMFATGCSKEEKPDTGDTVTTDKSQQKCPVMGNKIDKTNFVDHEGSRVYFCCKSCVETFKKDPGKYMEKLKSEGIVLEKTP